MPHPNPAFYPRPLAASSRWLSACLLMASALLAQAQTQPACGSLSNAYGPFDYRSDRAKLPTVETAHFTDVVEALIRGSSATRPGQDIDYTLRAIPNHHRALIAMMRLGAKENTDQPSGSRYSVDCWFERAALFRPDDSIVRMIYSTYLNSKSRVPEATRQLDMVAAVAHDNPLTHFNLGLHYFDLKQYEKALAQDHAAAALGWQRTELREQLRAVGKWVAPAQPSPSPVAENDPTGH